MNIAITHAFFPVMAAHEKADEDNVPFRLEDQVY